MNDLVPKQKHRRAPSNPDFRPASGAHPLDLVERWIASPPQGLLGLQVCGPSGTGKTHFLEQCRVLLTSSGCPVVTGRGRPEPLAWRDRVDGVWTEGSERGAVLVDEAHRLTLDDLEWLEDEGLARLPAAGLIVLVGSARPNPYWALSPLRDCFHPLALPPLSRQEALACLARRGLDPKGQAEAADAAHGNFAALMAEAEAQRASPSPGKVSPSAGRDEYLRRVLASAPSHLSRRGLLLACAMGQVTEDLLLTFLPSREARETIDWLRRSLDFVPLPTGLVPSKMGRHLLWGDSPEGEIEGARDEALSRARDLAKSEDSRTGLISSAACLHLIGGKTLRPGGEPMDLGSLEVTPFGPDEVARISRDPELLPPWGDPWRAPASVLAIRDRSARPLGVLREIHLRANSKLDQPIADPSLRRGWWWLHDHRRLRGLEHATLLEGYAFPSEAATDAPWPAEVVFWALLRALQRRACVATFVNLPDPEPWCTVITALGGRRLPGDGESVLAVFPSANLPPALETEEAAFPTWSERGFLEAVVQALDADLGLRLPAGHPLLNSRIVRSRLDEHPATSAVLQSLLREQISALHRNEEGARVFPVARSVFLLGSKDRTDLARTVGLTSRTVTRHLRRAEQIVASKLWTQECGSELESISVRR